jgi:hypothetical protein
MKRALSILGLVGVTALVTFLAITRHLAQERAARLDGALMDAEARIIELEAKMDAAEHRLAQLAKADAASRPTASALRQPRAAVAASSSETQPPANPALPGTSAPGVVRESAAMPAPGVMAVTGPIIRYAAFSKAGFTNLVRIEGTSTVHDWQVEGHLIGGSAGLGSGFPTQLGAPVEAGAADATLNVFIPVRSLKSVEKDGRPYSDAMDEIMYSKLSEPTNKRITYTLKSLALKEQSRDATKPFLYEAIGDLTVAGKTNTITMPVSVSPYPDGRIQFTGSIRVKMTDFNIVPPSPSLGGVSINTGDEVTLRFAWWVNRLRDAQAGK